MSALVRQTARENGVRTIASDRDDAMASLIYYLRNDSWPILSWPTSTVTANQFDLDRPLTSTAPEPVLFVSDFCLPQYLAVYYSTVESLAPIHMPTGPHSTHLFFAFKLSGLRRDIGPLGTWPR
jgi:hypothetical protein